MLSFPADTGKTGLKYINVAVFLHAYVEGGADRLAGLGVTEQAVTQKRMEHEIKF